MLRSGGAGGGDNAGSGDNRHSGDNEGDDIIGVIGRFC